jgi:tetratricopeptide (TPR) repeat protein
MNIRVKTMELAVHTPPARRTVLVLVALTLIAILAFALVSRLVTRYKANERQLAWHVYEQGMSLYKAGDPARALDNFRTALTYDPDNFEYQLSLARALRDSGNLAESETYLASLWQRNPEDGVINLAMGRLAVRRNSVTDALRYYHNAIYGAWSANAEISRRNARLELIRFLIQQKSNALAESELITLVQTLPADPALHIEAAGLFMEIQDYDQAFSVYEAILKRDPHEQAALAGAGQAAFQLGRYRTAEQFLAQAVQASPADHVSQQSLQTANLVLSVDPFRRHLSDADRNRRLVNAFTSAGERLQNCAKTNGANLDTPTSPPTPLQILQASWKKMQPQVKSLRTAPESDVPDSIMDLVSQVESQTAQQCGAPTGTDLALLLVTQHRGMVDQ